MLSIYFLIGVVFAAWYVSYTNKQVDVIQYWINFEKETSRKQMLWMKNFVDVIMVVNHTILWPLSVFRILRGAKND